MDEYKDIIDLPHHISKNRHRMSQGDRAAQFSSFAALTGYEDMVDETARLTDKKAELNDDEIEELNASLNYVMDNIVLKPRAKITYFIPDIKKSGGCYTEVSCYLKKIDPVLRTITDTEDNTYHIDNVHKLDIEKN